MKHFGKQLYRQRACDSWGNPIRSVARRLSALRNSGLLVSVTFGTLLTGGSLLRATPTLTTLANFSGTNGGKPISGLVSDAAGNLYGTTAGVGFISPTSYDWGTAFQVASGTRTLSTLVKFNFYTSGANPQAGLVSDAAGNLYGVTESGPENNTYPAGAWGTVYQVAAGTHAFSTLAVFDHTHGSAPSGAMIVDAAGNLYGTTAQGGANNVGTVFEVAAGTHAISNLATFDGNNGGYPEAGLIADRAGNLYGTTNVGGANNCGTVFQIADGTHVLSTLVTFNGGNGKNPYAGLIADSAGNLYGATHLGGANDDGTIFQVAAGTHVLTTLATFNGSNGAQPYGSLIADAAGNLYGTTESGGAYNQGTAFEITAGTNSIATLATFQTGNDGYGIYGANPFGNLFADAAGNLYGTTMLGGTGYYGTVFELTGTGFVTSAPEPAAASLMGLAGLGLLARRRRSCGTLLRCGAAS